MSCHRAVVANIFPQGFNKSLRLKNRLHATCRHRYKGYMLDGFVAVQVSTCQIPRPVGLGGE